MADFYKLQLLTFFLIKTSFLNTIYCDILYNTQKNNKDKLQHALCSVTFTAQSCWGVSASYTYKRICGAITDPCSQRSEQDTQLQLSPDDKANSV